MFEEELYNEKLRIVLDWELFLKQAMKNKTFDFINEDVSCFDMSGISSTNMQLVKQERDIVIHELIPNMLIGDYELMDEMEALLNKNHVRKVLEYGNKRKVYHKLITFFLMFIGFIV